VRTPAHLHAKLMLPGVWLVVAIIFPALCGISVVAKQKSKVAPESDVSARLELARKFRDQGWLGEAQMTLQGILAAHPDNSDARTLLEQVRAAQRQRADLATKLQLAEAARSAGLLDDAKSKLEDILKTDPEYPEANTLLAEVLAAKGRLIRQREQMQLDAAEWELKTGNTEKAIELSQKVMDSTNDPEIGQRARKIHDAARPTGLRQFWIVLVPTWVGSLLVGLLVVAALWCLLLVMRASYGFLYRRFRRWRGAGLTWRVRSISDSTPFGADSLVMSAFSKLSKASPEPVSAGLLKLEALILPPPHLLLPAGGQLAIDLAGAVEKLQLKVAGVEVGALARFLQQLGQWFRSGLPSEPNVSGMAFLSGATPTEVTVRLTMYSPDGSIATVSAAVAGAPGLDAAQSAAERAAEKMYYLLAEEVATETNVVTADAIVEGLSFLRRYVNGEKDGMLEKALEKFGALRAARPEFLEACLYEGIALDLLERHDEAIERFNYVQEDTQATDPLHDKAIYNQAVAHMRKYRPEDLERAVQLFQQVSGTDQDILTKPIKLLARAGRANAIAHYPIFWQRLLHGRKPNDDEECRAWKRKDRPQVFGWLEEVKRVGTGLRQDLQTIHAAPGPGWDSTAMRQLDWAISNAVGNAHLNVATGFLEAPRPPEFDDMTKKQEEFLREARHEFQRCEMLLTPGVETLTNLSTTLLYLNRFNEARAYAERAIELNKNYQYAFYRLAQSWDREGRGDKTKEVLLNYREPVWIREFKDLFKKYEVPLPG
jgi:tetratricopeptide (TPR) repeat protein